MKIKISNLGKIKETVLDLRPLTVIVGPNNSNKTYVAYSIYGLLRLSHTFWNEHKGIRFGNKKDGSLSLKLESVRTPLWRHSFRLCYDFKKEITTFFQDSSRKIFASSEFEITISTSEVEEKLRDLIEKKRLKSILKQQLKVELNSNELNFKYDQDDSTRPRLMASTVRGSLLYGLFEPLRELFFPKPYVLPAERSGLLLSYKLLVNRRYALLRESQRWSVHEPKRSRAMLERLKGQGEMGYPEPLEAFLESLLEIEAKANTQFDSKKRDKFHRIATLIEAKIQDGNKTTFQRSNLGRELRVNVRNGLDIDLYNASSSIQQLAPLLLYLRFVAAENQLLIIDEPEMNLHPESQAKLLEILAIMVNQGIKVLLTTHSPYIMAHLNNLVSGRLEDSSTLKEQASALYLHDRRAFLPLENVSAYEMKDGKLDSLKDADYGIRWETLSDVSAQIQQKYFEISERGKGRANGKNNQD